MKELFCVLNLCSGDNDRYASIHFMHTVWININIQSWLQVLIDSNKWGGEMVSSSFVLFVPAGVLSQPLCYCAPFFRGFIWRGGSLCLFCFFQSDKYLLWFFDKVYPTERIFLISGSKRDLHSFSSFHIEIWSRPGASDACTAAGCQWTARECVVLP